MEDIALIAARINGRNEILFWKNEIKEVQVGDYIIAENRDDLALIKVEGIVLTTKSRASLFSKTNYENMKSTKLKIPKEKLENNIESL